ncbi:MAG: substrate-binding domain-containing protein [Acidimicrobiales bacterium]
MKRGGGFAGRSLRVLCGCAGLFATILLWSSPALAGGPTINGTGSSYAAVAINQWVAQVASLDGDNVNYSTSSSVIGLNEFALAQVDFGASEIGYSTGQANNVPPAGYSYQYLPDVAGAICLDYNLQSQTGQQITTMKLSSDVIAKIFTGAISTWNNPAIVAENPGMALPSAPIVVAYRTDPSGDNFLFSNYLNTVQQSQWGAFTQALSSPPGAQALWPTPPSGARSVGPYNFGNWNGVNGSDIASGYVFNNVNSITYVETAYAILHHDPCIAIQNASGAFVMPSRDNDAEALLSDQLEPDLEQLLTGVYLSPAPTAYPISAYSYLITGVGSEVSSDKATVMAQFVRFIACQGQQSAGQLGYSPLPPNLVQADFDAVQRITGVALPPPTAQNCLNPYVDGQIPLLGEPNISTTAQGPTSAGAVAAGPITTTTGAASGGAAGAGAGHGGTGAGSGASGTGGSAGSTAGAASGSTAQAVAVATTTTTAPPVIPAGGQAFGVELEHVTTSLLGVKGPTGQIALYTTIFLALIILPPAIALFRRRRHGTDGGEVSE